MTADPAILRQIVEGYLQENHPDLLDEFAVSFEDVAESIARGIAADDHPGESQLGFDSTLLTGTVIAAAGWIAAKFLDAAFRDSIKRDLLPRMDRMEKLLVRHGAERKMVKRIRARVQAVLKNMSGS